MMMSKQMVLILYTEELSTSAQIPKLILYILQQATPATILMGISCRAFPEMGGTCQAHW